jgi:3-hydroxyacyl-CoA dehydrogenase
MNETFFFVQVSVIKGDLVEVSVLGAGVMGHGIAQVAAQTAKFDVVIYARTSAQEALSLIENNLEISVAKGQITRTEMSAVLNRIRTSSKLQEAVANADLIIEAVPEELVTKCVLLRNIENYISSDVVVATNTSSLNISQLACSLDHPERFCGMHFFNPPQLMKLVEITRGNYTSDHTVSFVSDVADKMGKKTIVLEKEVPGFIANRIAMAALNEAAELCSKGVASIEDIDKAVRLGLNWPAGALELIDYIGVDTVLAVLENLARDNPKYEPSVVLRRLKSSNFLGRKSGKGFYDWERQ